MVILSEIRNNLRTILTKSKENSIKSRENREIKDTWIDLMSQRKISNADGSTYTISKIEKTNYGNILTVKSPIGLSITDLESLKDMLETAYQSTVMIDINDDAHLGTVKLIKSGVSHLNGLDFKPCTVKPWELCYGLRVDGSYFISDMNVSPNSIIAGQVRKGKTVAIDIAITSLINSCNEKEINLILLDCAKCDLSKYANCKQVKAYTTDIIEMEAIMKKAVEVVKERITKFKPMIQVLKGDNIKHWNELHPDDKLPYIYIVVEEFMAIAYKEGRKNDKLSVAKDNIKQYMAYIAQCGGSSGVVYIVCHQKPEAELMPTFLKNMTNTRICFGFNDKVCSEIVLGNQYAYKLPSRRAYATTGEGFELIFTPNIRDNLIKYINKSVVNYHRTWLHDMKVEIDPTTKEPKPKPNVDGVVKFDKNLIESLE